MRFLSRASPFALLLAPALARAAALPELREESNSSAYVLFELPDEFPVDQLDFAFSVRESLNACDKPNVAINSQSLPNGSSGTFTARRDTSFGASWNFTCVEGTGFKEQLMSLSIDSVSGMPVKDMTVFLRFRQLAPVKISNLKGPASMVLFDDRPHGSDVAHETSPSGLVADLDELDTLRTRAAEIHRLIRARERLIAESYVWVRGNTLGNCDSIGCVFKTLLDKASGFATSLLYGGDGRHRHHRWRGPPRWWRHRHHGHGHPGCGHGNHTLTDLPPWRRPHYRHGPPPSPCKCRPEHGPSGQPGSPSPPQPDWPAPPAEDGNEVSLPPPPPPPPPKWAPISSTEEWDGPVLNHPLSGDRPGRPWRPHGHPAPPSRYHPHGGPISAYGHPGRLWWPFLVAKVLFCSILLAGIIILAHRCCRRRQDGEKPTGSWWQRLKARREARKRRRAEQKAAVKRAFFRLTNSLYWLGRQLRGVYGEEDEEKRMMLAERRRAQQQQEQQQPQPPPQEELSEVAPTHPGYDGGDLNAAVADEIAGLRIAADVVSEIIAAEEGRARRQRREQPQTAPQPPPPPVNVGYHSRHLRLSSTAEFVDYIPRPSSSSDGDYDEALPAYEATETFPPSVPCPREEEEEEEDSSTESPASSVVVDGFMYVPGTSSYTPGSRGGSVAGSGSADALGDTKN